MRTNVKQAHDGPIFVLCAARSGSTLLRRALDNHPELACPPEINLASAFETIHFAFASTGASDDGVARERARDLCRRLADETAGEYAKARGKSRWCDKSLPSIDYADSLLEVFPSAQFFCLYRECTDTVASAIEACPWGFNGYGFDPYVRSSPTNFVLPLASYWADKAETLNRFEQAHGNLCHRVRYEDLVQRPLEVMNRAFEFLGCAGLGLDELNGLFRLNRELAVGDYKTRFTQRFETSSVGRGWRVPIELIPPPLQVRIDALHAELGYPVLSADVRESTATRAPIDSAGSGRVYSVEDLVRFRISPRLRRFDTDGQAANVGEQRPTQPRIRLQLLDRTEDYVLDFDKRHVDVGDDGNVDCVVATTSSTLVAIANRDLNPGVALRKMDLRAVCTEGARSSDTTRCLDALLWTIDAEEESQVQSASNQLEALRR